LNGFETKELKQREDLSGFYWTTVNDVETRFIPTLGEILKDLQHKAVCKMEGTLGACCSIVDQGMGCEATSLSDYCAWFGSGTDTDAYVSCYYDYEFWHSVNKAYPNTWSVDNQLTAYRDATTNALNNNLVNDLAAQIEALCETKRIGLGIADDAATYLAQCEGDDLDAVMARIDVSAFTDAHRNWFNTVMRNNAKIRKAQIDNQQVDMFYQEYYETCEPGTADKDCVGNTTELVTYYRLTSLAPQVLLKNAQDFDGNPSTKNDLYKEYNTIGFEGGGSIMEYTWGLGTSKGKTSQEDGGFTTDFNTITTEHEWLDTDKNSYEDEGGIGVLANYEIKAWTLGVGAHFRISANAMLSEGRDQKYHKSAETVDDSNARFHFEDPDVGDYFVVSIFEDPEYQTPLFVNSGGASSCAWEVETAHRTDPNLELEYVGPEFLPANDPAIFKATLKNYRYYYEKTAVSPERGTDMWSSSSLGYRTHDYTLYVDTSDVANGLAVSIGGANLVGNGLLFFSFGKKSVEVMVEVRRGLAAYEYPSPSLYFEELCVEQTVGEAATPMKLNNMPFGSGDVGIQFYRPCPSLIWSADRAESTKFVISQGSPTIDLQALVNTVGGITDDPGFAVGNNDALHDGYTQDPEDTNIAFTTQFRQAGETVWTNVLDNASALTYQRVGINPLVTGTLYVKNAIREDGNWELRLEADCYAPGAGTGRDEFDKSYTSVLTGTVDMNRPEVVAVTTTSGSTLMTVADMVYVIYSETIDCSRAYGRLTFGASTSSPIAFATAGPQRLRLGCDGPKLWMSMIKPTPKELAAGPVTILVNDVTDLAGNPADVAQDEWNAALREAAASRKDQEEALARMKGNLDGAQRSLDAVKEVEEIVVGYTKLASRRQQRRRHTRQLPSSVGLRSDRERRALTGISLLVSERVAKEAQLNEWERNTQSNASVADIALLTAEIERLLEAELGVDADQWSIELVAVQSEREDMTAMVEELDVMVKGAQQTLAELKRVETAAQSDSNRLVSSANADASADDSKKYHDDIYALLTACMFFVIMIFAILVFAAYSSRATSRGDKESSAEVERLRAELQAHMNAATSDIAEGALDPTNVDAQATPRRERWAAGGPLGGPTRSGGGPHKSSRGPHGPPRNSSFV
jgi:uncharacterized small protein (DUF1192 family)